MDKLTADLPSGVHVDAAVVGVQPEAAVAGFVGCPRAFDCPAAGIRRADAVTGGYLSSDGPPRRPGGYVPVGVGC